jgi:hypothetical protein
MREEEKEIDRKLYKILGYEKCSEADQAIEKIKDLLSSQLKEVLNAIESADVHQIISYKGVRHVLIDKDELAAEVERLV